MIEPITYNLFKTYGPGSGTAISLGDQRTAINIPHPDAPSLFKSLGYDDYIDIDYNGNAKINHNLNYMVPPALHQKASLLYDGGVCEHVSNIGVALTSIVRMMSIGGSLVQVVPINAYGASYYGIDPSLLFDFYRANGIECRNIFLVSKGRIRTYIQWKLEKIVGNRAEGMRSNMRKNPTGIKARIAKWLACDSGNIRYHPVAPGPYGRRVPVNTHVYYIGLCKKKVTHINWPSQSIYPDLSVSITKNQKPKYTQ